MITETDIEKLTEIERQINEGNYPMAPDIAWLVKRLKELNADLGRSYRLNAILRGLVKEIL